MKNWTINPNGNWNLQFKIERSGKHNKTMKMETIKTAILIVVLQQLKKIISSSNIAYKPHKSSSSSNNQQPTTHSPY